MLSTPPTPRHFPKSERLKQLLKITWQVTCVARRSSCSPGLGQSHPLPSEAPMPHADSSLLAIPQTHQIRSTPGFPIQDRLTGQLQGSSSEDPGFCAELILGDEYLYLTSYGSSLNPGDLAQLPLLFHP